MTYDAHNDPQHVPGIAYVNPGAGPVDGATFEHARHAMLMLMQDVFGSTGWATDREMLERPGVEWWFERRPDLDDAGRFGFEVRGGPVDIAIGVHMPGLPLDQVRYVGAEYQNIWHYPRLLIEVPLAPGWPDSWVWCFMVDAIRERAMIPAGASFDLEQP